MKIEWLDAPEDHDYDAAKSYLTLAYGSIRASELVSQLKRQKGMTQTFKAKDIIRASGEPLLPEDNKHVQSDLKKVHDGKKLSPVLLVSGREGDRPLIIADGYHRVCASYLTDENEDVPAVLAS